MHWILYFRLVLLTAGTLLPFFWMVVILGHRRQPNFDRVFFFLCLALTCFFGSSLLALNAELYYTAPPQGLLRFAWTFLCLGLFFIPPLILHLHVEYASLRELPKTAQEKYLWLAIAWLPAALLGLNLGRTLRLEGQFDLERPSQLLGLPFQCWLAFALLAAATWQRRFTRVVKDREQKSFHRAMTLVLLSLAFVFVGMVVLQRTSAPATAEFLLSAVMFLALLPLGILISNVQRFNFLQIGRERNLIIAVSGVFLRLLYLIFVRRASLWLDLYLPPEASAALLLF